jgi:uncharacterized repeat protein (TIGR03943 family)
MRLGIGPVLLFVVGAVILRLVLFGDFRDYVKPSQGPLLLAAAAVLLTFGLVGAIQHARHDDPGPERRHTRLHTHGPMRVDPELIEQARQQERAQGHDHNRTPGVAWLLVVPMVLVLMVPPPALGAYAASRAGAPVPQPVTTRSYPPLPASPSPLPLEVHDYAERAAWDDGRTLTGHPVTLTGFVTPKTEGGWYLTRFVITCCAADSRTYLVEVLGTGDTPVTNSWQQVTGTYAPAEHDLPGGPTARIAATSVNPIDQPQDPYELP